MEKGIVTYERLFVVLRGNWWSLSLSALGNSGAGDRENTGGDLNTSLFAAADEVIGVVLLLGIDEVVRPTAGIGEKTLEGAGKKLRESS